MGEVTPPFHWIPEDDLLLKNAVEAGASLESLAKGAVHFSRRFTVQELQDRWYSLLYDPVVSEEASSRMIEFEHSASTLLSKPYRLESRKETNCISRKRKSESIHKCYYAMRKRISNEPSDTMDVDFLSGPGHMNFRDGNEPPSANFMIENSVPNHFEIQDPNFDIVNRSFPAFATCAAEPTGHDVMPSINNHVGHIPFDGNDVSQSVCPTYGKNISLPGNHSAVPVFGPLKELPVCNVFEAESLEANHPAVFGDINNSEGNVSSEFEGSSFHNFGYSSPLPQMPIWSTIDGISVPTLPFQLGEKDQQTGDTFLFPHSGDANNTSALGYDVLPSNSDLKNPMPCDNMKNLTASTDDYFEQLSSTLFDFTKEELLLMDADENDTIDKSYFDGLSSLLLDSPNVSVSEGSVTPDGQFTVSTGAYLRDTGKKGQFHSENQNCLPKSQVSPYVSCAKAFGPECRDGVISCILNSEDTEVPSNDDVFLPFRVPSPSNSSGTHWRLHDAYYPLHSFVKDFPSTQKAIGGPSLTKKERKESHVLPQILGLPQQSETGLNNPIGDIRIKFELPNSNIQHAAVRNAKSREGPSQARSVNACTMEQGKILDHDTAGPCLDGHTCGPDTLQNFQKFSIGSKNEVDATITVPNSGESNADLSSTNMIVQEPIEEPTLSDQEEFCSENDFDVPYFSDVEAMILDMDLSPVDFDLHSNQKVLRYQHEETKRTMIRLEQAADAYMQRAIAAPGAFAVLYGRRSEHFIMKPQVLLGRSTDDFKVDIDLGREGCANKISRRQASIELDPYGLVHLKNLGKISIHVNSKEVAPKQSVNLTSGCLIEVKGLAYVFETNQTRIKQYVDDIMGGSIF
ncbi:Forkhead-associated (FHA) domain-containing protein [Abeliophyllum distichum]|uniref:Forkhead-associated (FHA) domain-containing protein n=1 Tax=Abeliophyllum distichum TaxID=126358 RepID=A0ABD1SGQ8_9LAMI